IYKGNVALLVENTDPVTDFAEDLGEVRGRKHRGRHYGVAIRNWQLECAILLDCMKWENKLRLRARELQMIARGLLSTKHVLLAHIIPTRKCNLACGYCNEYDDFSPPIPTDEMIRRIDRLAFLKTAIVTISGGEPLLHPDI